MASLHEKLQHLGLSQYLEGFFAEGFDTWETLLDITESDLSALNVNLGHRRKLQQAIAESDERTQSYRPPIIINNSLDPEAVDRNSSPGLSRSSKRRASIASSNAASSTKRKYRRHPRPDEHAPKRPLSAYVLFANEVRTSLDAEDMTFSEIAKVVGQRWQMLLPSEQEGYRLQSEASKKKYADEMAEYKKTPEYDSYQKYVKEFEAKQSQQIGDLDRTQDKAQKKKDE